MKVNGPVVEVNGWFLQSIWYISTQIFQIQHGCRCGKRHYILCKVQYWRETQRTAVRRNYYTGKWINSRANKLVDIRTSLPYHWHLTHKTIDTVSLFPSKSCVKMVLNRSSIIPDKSFIFFPWQKSLYIKARLTDRKKTHCLWANISPYLSLTNCSLFYIVFFNISPSEWIKVFMSCL